MGFGLFGEGLDCLWRFVLFAGFGVLEVTGFWGFCGLFLGFCGFFGLASMVDGCSLDSYCLWLLLLGWYRLFWCFRGTLFEELGGGLI